MKKGIRRKKRICALVLVLALALTGILPGVGSVAQAENAKKQISFHVYETVSETGQEKGVPGATVTVYENDQKLVSAKTDENGDVLTTEAYDESQSYTYTVEKKRYVSAGKKDLNISGQEPIQVLLSAEEKSEVKEKSAEEDVQEKSETKTESAEDEIQGQSEIEGSAENQPAEKANTESQAAPRKIAMGAEDPIDVKIRGDDIIWDTDNISRVYNGTDVFEVTGTVTNDENQTIEEGDSVNVSAKFEFSGAKFVCNNKECTGTIVAETLTAEDTGKYKVEFDTDTESITLNNISITVKQQVLSDEQIWGMIKVTESDDGVFIDNDQKIWIKPGERKLTIQVNDDTLYDQVVIEGSGTYNSDSKEYTYTATESSPLPITGIYLKNSGDPEESTRTTAVDGNESQNNQIPSGKIMADNKDPQVTFTQLANSWLVKSDIEGSSGQFGGFSIFAKTFIENETITVTDEESGLDTEKAKYQIVSIPKGEINETDYIKSKAEEESWKELDLIGDTAQIDVPGSSPEAGYYVVLVQAADLVGNKAIYASNGMVLDVAEPEVTLTLPEPDKIVEGIPVYSKKVEYKLNVTDSAEDDKISAGIKQIEVEVTETENNNKVDGSYENGKVVDSCIIEESELNKLNSVTDLGQDSKSGYSLVDLKNKQAYEISGTIGCNSNNIVIKVIVTDKADNKSENMTVITGSGEGSSTNSKQLAIDTTAPEITVAYDNNSAANDKYFSTDRTMTITYKERNFDEDRVSFDVKAGTASKERVSLKNLKSNKIPGITVKEVQDSEKIGEQESAKNHFLRLTDDREVTYEIRFGREEVEDDMDFEITPYIKDIVGYTEEDGEISTAKGTVAPFEFTVDEVKPVISVVYKVNGDDITSRTAQRYYEETDYDITATVTIIERNFALADSFSEDPKYKQIDLTSFKAVDSSGNPVSTAENSGDAENRNAWTKVSGEENTYTQTFTFTADANYTFKLDYKDLAGNPCASNEAYFTIDKTDPTGSISVGGKSWDEFNVLLAFRQFTNSSTKVTLTSSDATSGVKSTQYYKYIPDVEERGTFSGLTVEELDKIDYDSWVSGKELVINAAEKNEQVIVYERVEDKCGHVVYITAKDGIIADSRKPDTPEITITTAKPANDIFNQNVAFTINVEDVVNGATYAGLKEVSYEVRNNGTVTQSGNYNSALADETARVKSLTRSEVVNASLNNSNHVTIWVKAVDYAGNTSEATKDIKIDVTKPRVEITFDQNSPRNEKYYNTTRRATVTVYERNFDPNAVDFTITNTDGTMPSIGEWHISPQAGESDEAANTCVVTFAADGDYTLTMNCTDLAGNRSSYNEVHEFTIDQTVPTINVSFDNNAVSNGRYYNAPRTATITVDEHNFNGSEVQTAISASLQAQGITAPGVNGWSGSGDQHSATVLFNSDGDYSFTVNYTDLAGNAATVYSVEQFTIDQTKPTIEIFDIENKSANNGTVAPGVNYSDVNYDVNNVTISLKGENHKVTGLSGSRTSIPNGQSIKMNDFAHEPEVDDVYTLTAQVTDLAGNSEEQSVIFSVNRFGSNYIFSDETKAFLNQYYSNQEQDIVVTEINVDTLVHNGISYGRDGELVNLEQGTDYTVKASGNDESWKSYQYTINAANFEKEGLYDITIDSEDRATNVVNNKIKDANIEFVIDKTSPTVVITGIDNNEQYRANTRDIIVSVVDNVAMGDMDIYVDDDRNPVRSYKAEDIIKQNGEVPYTLESSSNWQNISAVAVDAAGNTAKSPDYRVLLTSNILVQFYRNTPLFVGVIVGIVVAAGFIIFILYKRRRRDEEETAA